jgi:hypothetical protein
MTRSVLKLWVDRRTNQKIYPTSGFWKLNKLNGKVILEILSSDKRKIRQDIIYLDREGNMVADRQ